MSETPVLPPLSEYFLESVGYDESLPVLDWHENLSEIFRLEAKTHISQAFADEKSAQQFFDGNPNRQTLSDWLSILSR